ncbi:MULTISPECIES: GmrSD restriction endonuclease domain-containing protein [unclassified Gordonia (in: high G+C Gram-positive bacteria)]
MPEPRHRKKHAVRIQGLLWAFSAVASAALVATISTEPAQAAPPPASSVLADLNSLPVKGRAPMTGYSRAQFGQAWSDDVAVAQGHNGCDTRNDILRRDLTAITLKPGTDGCVVASGTLTDPYTATVIPFVRGPQSRDVEIDHVVALGDAWQKGAQQWSPDTRRDFANDPRNLLAVSGPANQQKGDGDAATWLPPNKSFRCTYVSTQVEVKKTYGLWVTAAEKQAMQRVLSSCAHPDPTPPTTTTPPATAPPATPQSPGGTYYANCSQARAAGAAPIYAGQPGYRPGLDRDGDGVACE